MSEMDALIEKVRHLLGERPPRTLMLPGLELRESAVLLPLVERDRVPHVIFTRRPMSMKTHAGQIAFPGGARDEDDATLLHTALREAHEELGIPPERVTVLGRLDELPTPTRFRISPFVGAIPADVSLAPAVGEVDEVFEVPLPLLLEPHRWRTEKRTAFGREHDIYFYDYGPHVIWGATAHILKDLLERLEGP